MHGRPCRALVTVAPSYLDGRTVYGHDRSFPFLISLDMAGFPAAEYWAPHRRPQPAQMTVRTTCHIRIPCVLIGQRVLLAHTLPQSNHGRGTLSLLGRAQAIRQVALQAHAHK